MLIYLLFSLALVAGSQAQAQAVAVAQEQCVDESEIYHSIYHAPARAVPFPRVDATIRRGFLGLLHRDAFPDHVHNSSFDSITAEACEPSVIDAAIIAQINELCPRSGFFYSFAPRHLSATMLLQQQFMNQSTPAEVLRVAGAILRRHEVNPRVWYYALLGTLLRRPDLNGYYLAWAVDATPDLYITNTVINLATQGSTRPQAQVSSRQCTTSIGVTVTDTRIEHPEATPTAQQQQQAQNMCQNQNSTRAAPRVPSAPEERPPAGRTINNLNSVTTFGPQTRGASYDSYIYLPTYEVKEPWARGGYQRLKRQTRQRQCVPYNGTLGATGAENLLWYFREDMMVNQHHWYWHQYFPQASTRHADRRGEQFYFTHHNLIARYNAERLSNGLPMETPLDLRLGGNVGEGYDSDLVDRTSGRLWTARVANTPLSDVLHMQDRDFQLDARMADITQLFANLTSHIAQGFLLANRSNQIFPVDIRNMEGMSHLGNTIEAAEELSTHAQFYNTFGVHNLGHIGIALATDPDFSCQLPTGVMADLTVTMRDPAFYKIHTLVDDMFHGYKNTLPTYHPTSGEWPLQWAGVTVRNLELLSGTGQRKINIVNTFWNIRRFPLEEGIDGSIHDGDLEVDICHQHLNHEPFTIRMTIDVNSCARTISSRGTVRIFMAPRYNVNGARFTMDDTRKLMFQLDAFPVDLRRGRNTITRNSQDSSSTRPWSRSLQEMLRDPDNGGETEYCGCGWPRHLYIPKGTPQGMEFDLFAMVTNFDQDQVLDTVPDLNIQEPCNSPYIFCGVPYRRHPDARPMGYPFDRSPYPVVDGAQLRPPTDLEEYTAHVSNMKSSVVIIQHLDTILA